MSGKHISYAVNSKLQIIALAENTNKSMATRHFSVNEKLVRDLRKKKNDLSEMQ